MTALDSVLRQHAEQQYASELEALSAADTRQRPPRWKMSPWAVGTYLLGGQLDNGVAISPKYIGNPRVIEIAVATLATDRALLLLGVSGTAKSWVSEHLAAAISGDSTLVVQGTAGTSEEAGGGTLLAHSDTLWNLVNGWLLALPAGAFTELLPLLRRMVATFSAPERRELGERAAHAGGATAAIAPPACAVDPARAARVLPVLHTLFGIRPLEEIVYDE